MRMDEFVFVSVFVFVSHSHLYLSQNVVSNRKDSLTNAVRFVFVYVCIFVFVFVFIVNCGQQQEGLPPQCSQVGMDEFVFVIVTNLFVNQLKDNSDELLGETLVVRQQDQSRCGDHSRTSEM